MPYLISTVTPEQSALRYIIFGGEALELQSLQPWFDCYGAEPTRLINMYGITETTVHVTYRPITRTDIKSKVGSVIGRPIPDLKVYVLDAYQHLQPLGIPGEIYVGGAGVAHGYLHRPELTAERFIADPISGDPQARLYRSGDLARWLPNGELEYLGRIDDQVKIRGYRIELGEIKAVLDQHPAIQTSAVVVREDTPGDQRLVAYVVARSTGSLDVTETRKYLKQKLPEYMIPSAWVPLDELPLTPNGKIDSRALPAPDQNRPAWEGVYQPPRTRTEQALARIWAEVLKLNEVGIHDNFFELGGHSLLATQVVSRIRTVFSIELPLRHMFESPTVAAIAVIIEESLAQRMSEAELAYMLSEIEVTTEDEAQKVLLK
jgi:acyl carrier protein